MPKDEKGVTRAASIQFACRESLTLGAVTGAMIADLIAGRAPALDASPYRITRFCPPGSPVTHAYFPRANVTKPSLLGIGTFGSVLASIVSFSPTTPLSCKI